MSFPPLRVQWRVNLPSRVGQGVLGRLLRQYAQPTKAGGEW
jgi:hypothetical protein